MLTLNQLRAATLKDLNDLKAIDIVCLEVKKLTPLMDYMFIATGTSSKHVRSIAEHLVQEMKLRDVNPAGIEADGNDEWILVDLGDLIVHIMQTKTREFYNIEKLWSTSPEILSKRRPVSP